jgi:flagellar FliL protein
MADEETEAEASGGGGNKLIIAGAVVVALVVGLGGGFGVATMMGGSDAAEPLDDEALAALDPVEAERVVHPLDPFTLNLRGGGGGRMLRLEVHLEVAAPDVEQITERDAVLRDAVLALASDQTYADLEGLDGKTYLRDELLRRLNAVLDGPRIERVYFTDFVVQ